LHKSRFLLADLLQDTAASFAAQAAAAGIQLHTEVSQPGLQLTADHLRLSQVLANLVSNALRYTPQGGSILLAAEPAGAGRVRLRVRDTGRGIPAEDLPFIFDRFWRGDKSRTREGHANSGLGLAISRQLILAHGGSIEAHSQPGLGAEFIIELPES
jgi:two-component system sensor histidine kinase BaeS